MTRDSLAGASVVLLAAACCLVLPIVVSAGAGAAAWALGLGLPLTLFAVLVAWVVVRRRRDHPGTFVLTVDEAFDVANRSWPALFGDVLASTPSAGNGVAGGDQ